MQMTSEMVEVWVTHLILALKQSPTYSALLNNYFKAKNEVALMFWHELMDLDERDNTLIEIDRIKKERRTEILSAIRLNRSPLLKEPLASAVREFTGIQYPKECRHEHQQKGTGVFFQSLGLIQCNTCSNWQMIRKPVV